MKSKESTASNFFSYLCSYHYACSMYRWYDSDWIFTTDIYRAFY